LKIAEAFLAPTPQINAAETMLVTVVVAQKLLGFVAQIKHIAQHPWVIALSFILASIYKICQILLIIS